MLNRLSFFLIFGFALMMLINCGGGGGGGGGGSAPAAATDISGEWSIQYGEGYFPITMSQTGNSFSGSGTDNTSSFAISGTMSALSINFTFTRITGSVTRATGTVGSTGSTMSGTWADEVGGGTGTFSGYRISGGTGTVRINNQHGSDTILFVYLTLVESSTWGSNRIPSKTIAPGTQVDIPSMAPGSYDILLEFSGGRFYESTLTVSPGVTTTVIYNGGAALALSANG